MPQKYKPKQNTEAIEKVPPDVMKRAVQRPEGVTGLIRSGSMKLEDRPLWYEVYQAFPPETPPRYDNLAPASEVRKIFFPEDVIRAKFYRKLPSLPEVRLKENEEASICQVFVDNCRHLAESKGVTMEEAFDEAFASTKNSLITTVTESARRPETRTLRSSGNTKSLKDLFSEDSDDPPLRKN